MGEVRSGAAGDEEGEATIESIGVRGHVSALDSVRRLPVPRQQFVEPVDLESVDHALEHVVQIGVGLDVVHFASLDERAEYRSTLSANPSARGDKTVEHVFRLEEGKVARFDIREADQAHTCLEAAYRGAVPGTLLAG